MANEALGVFDAELTASALFDYENAPDGLFDRDLVKAAGGASFDPALMAAMNRPWPDIVFSLPQVTASGMTPPDHIPQ